MNKFREEAEEIVQESDRDNSKETLLKLFSLIDYTSLNITDNRGSIIELVQQVNHFQDLYQQNVAAVCVFPNFIPVVRKNLTDCEVKIASVSAGFPFSQSFDEVKLLETELAIQHGADEIDVVMPLGELWENDENKIIQDISDVKARCGHRKLKVILETSMLKNADLIRRASGLAIEGGADFIKTSTGKNGSIASLEAVIIMCDVISNHYKSTGRQIGIKPAGGISTYEEALKYYTLVKKRLGENWMNKDVFRIGASSLIKDVIARM